MLKTIFCLSNSRKISARCIAGKDIFDNSWVRPVSSRDTHEIYQNHRRYEDGSLAEVFDVITIDCIEHQPQGHQPENYLINEQQCWIKEARLSAEYLQNYLDDGPLPWANNFSSSGKSNDRVPVELLEPQQGSLKLIYAENVTLIVTKKMFFDSGMEKTVVRAVFQHYGSRYCFDVTDPEIERAYRSREHGQYLFGNAYLCVSLGEIFHGYSYKLVATILGAS